MTGYIIVAIVSIVLTAFICLTFFINKKDNEKIKTLIAEKKVLENNEKVIKENIKTLYKKAEEVKNEKSTTNIDDLICEFNELERIEL